jgi:serine/threonine protein kinase/tetratricopeptide (TPR) repeat protein
MKSGREILNFFIIKDSSGLATVRNDIILNLGLYMIDKTVLHYKILEKLGEGGMGVVYKAHDNKLKREVAIKFLPQNFAKNADDRKRFQIEAQAAAALNHPNIATIHAIEGFEDSGGDNEVFIVMEYIDGQELKNKIDESSFSLNETLEIATSIANGLQAAHEKGIIHRDIKSSNIMVTGDGKVKIMDFGLAKVAGGAMITKENSTLGTLAYMSPEQAQGKKADHRSDLWSFGIVFYELLTGELPFKAEHEAAWNYVIINDQPLTPTSLDRKIPIWVDAIVIKLLEKNPENRYQTAAEFLNDLKQKIQDSVDSKSEDKTKAIAVLPFDNISADEESDYFSNGLTEELIVNLSQLKDMRVLSRTTSMQYKDTKKDIKTIGKELGVRYIMEGSVRKFQENLRITAQLIDVESDTQLWAETYKGQLADVFDIQEQVSKQIVEALMVKLTPTEKVVLSKRSTVDPEAFDCNLRARNFLYRRTRNDVQIAIQLFQKAIELDQRYAAAYAGLGEAYATLYQVFERKDLWLDKALETSLKALMYDSSSSEAYASLGLAYFHKKEFDEAATASKKAIELDPNNYIGYWILGRNYHTRDLDNEAAKMFEKVVSINPDFYTAYNDLQISYEKLGEKEKFDQTVETALKFYPPYLSQYPDDARGHMFHAVLLAQTGKINEAKEASAKALTLSPDDPNMMYNASCFYGRLGDVKLAIETLKKSLNLGYQHYEWIKRDTDLNGIRDEPAYIELMKGK